ncbi:MAG: 1-acyl-sn-glycerol-3-phosphate acyltransferase, partial [Gemmataceae bacterium]
MPSLHSVLLLGEIAWPSSTTLLWSLGAAALGFFVLFCCRPDLVVRMICWVMAHTVYRMRITGRRNIPQSGPCLMVCNHVSFIDGLLLFTAQRRRVRFVIWAPFTKIPIFRVLLRWGRVIPIDSTAGPKAILRSLHQAADALKEGECVCI